MDTAEGEEIKIGIRVGPLRERTGRIFWHIAWRHLVGGQVAVHPHHQPVFTGLHRGGDLKLKRQVPALVRRPGVRR